MYINNVTLSNADTKNSHGISIVEVIHTAWGYRVDIQTYNGEPYDGRKYSLAHVRNGRAKVYRDYLYAGHYKYETAMKHAKNIMQGKYELV